MESMLRRDSIEKIAIAQSYQNVPIQYTDDQEGMSEMEAGNTKSYSMCSFI
jgi:hypothetical protein